MLRLCVAWLVLLLKDKAGNVTHERHGGILQAADVPLVWGLCLSASPSLHGWSLLQQQHGIFSKTVN